MGDSVYSSYPPELSPTQRQCIVSTIKDWTIHNGLAVRPSPTSLPGNSDPERVLATNAPVTLFPSPFPKTCFETAGQVQTTYNELYGAISRDEAWLGKIMEE